MPIYTIEIGTTKIFGLPTSIKVPLMDPRCQQMGEKTSMSQEFPDFFDSRIFWASGIASGLNITPANFGRANPGQKSDGK